MMRSIVIPVRNPNAPRVKGYPLPTVQLVRVSVLLMAFLSVGCVNVKEVDRRTRKPITALHVSANVAHLEFTSANGSHLVMDNFDPAKTHTAVGNMVSKAILSAGTAIATSGVLRGVKP